MNVWHSTTMILTNLSFSVKETIFNDLETLRRLERPIVFGFLSNSTFSKLYQNKNL